MRGLAGVVVRSLAAVARPREIDGQVLDPEIEALCRLDRLLPDLHGGSPRRSRARYLRSCRLAGPKRVPMEVEDRGRLRLYRPGPTEHGLLYFHGGGFVIGGRDSHDTICRRLARDSGRLVISAEYRLAPEHPFPAAVEDAIALWHEARPLVPHLAVGGDSAGGNLAAVVAQEVQGVERQLLIYPGVDMRGGTRSMELFAEDLLLSRELKDWFLDHYLQGADKTDPRLSPILGQPGPSPAHLVVAGFDILRDEGLAYAELLRGAGVEVEVVRFDRLPHGFLNIAGLSRASDSALTAIAALIRVDSAHG